jgi:hypothetical protein
MSSQLIGLVGKLFVPLAILGALALFRRYVPSTQVEGADGEYSIADLDARFAKAKWAVPVCMVLIGVLFAWGTYRAFVTLSRHFAAVDGPAAFRLMPQTATWWFFPGLGALALSYEITLQTWSLFGNRREANLYSEWSNLKTASRGGRYAGMDSRKVLRWMALVIALPIGILTALELSAHTSLHQSDICQCGFALSPCKVYPYADARRLTVIEGFRDRDGKLIRRAGIVVDFTKGRRWSSSDIGDFRKSVDPTLASFLANKTHLPLNSATTEADIPKSSDSSQ